MNEGGRGSVLSKKVGEVVEELLGVSEVESIGGGQFELRGKAAVAEEIHPVGLAVVELRRGADPVIPVPAKGRGSVPVEGGELLAHEGPVRWISIKDDIFHDEEGVLSDGILEERSGDADGPGTSDGLEALRFAGEGIAVREPIGFNKDLPAVLGVEDVCLMDAAAADRLGAGEEETGAGGGADRRGQCVPIHGHGLWNKDCPAWAQG